jgi:RND family efflux transporter MFP subunit
VQISGVLAPSQTVNLFSSIPGNAGSVLAQVGDRVHSGQLLIKLDTRRLDAQLHAAEAAVQSVEDHAAQAKVGIETARANLDLAQKSFDRIKALYASKAVSKSQYDDVQNKFQLAKNGYDNAVSQYQLLSGSSLAEARAQENLVQVQVNDGTIVSPIDGVVTNRNINLGEVVNMGAPLMTVADTSTLKLQGNVSQDVISAIHVGQTARVLVDGEPNAGYTGSVTQIGPVAASTGQYFPVVITLKNPGNLLAGMTATANLSITGSGALVVPTEAIRIIDGTSYVYLLQNGQAEQRKVVTGLSDGTRIQVSGELSKGDRVATSSLSILGNGMKVNEK